MSFDIDVILRAQAREREAMDRIKALLSRSFAYQLDKDTAFRYQKTIDGNPIQLDLLADVARIKEDQAILKIGGLTTSLCLCCVDGGEDLNDHIETVQINLRDRENVEKFEIAVPNAVGFLLLKTTVGHYREDPKDAYDIYYYCRYSEHSSTIQSKVPEGDGCTDRRTDCIRAENNVFRSR